jgi:hypothetical protein
MKPKPVVKRRLLGSRRTQPRGEYGENAYRFEDHGLDPEAERHRYRTYVEAAVLEADAGAGSLAQAV